MAAEHGQGWGTPADAKGISEQVKGHVYKKAKEINWQPHPMNQKVKLGFILTKKEDEVEVTCLLAKIPKGEEIPEHTHAVHDIIFPLSGRGKIWIKDIMR